MLTRWDAREASGPPSCIRRAWWGLGHRGWRIRQRSMFDTVTPLLAADTHDCRREKTPQGLVAPAGTQAGLETAAGDGGLEGVVFDELAPLIVRRGPLLPRGVVAHRRGGRGR